MKMTLFYKDRFLMQQYFIVIFYFPYIFLTRHPSPVTRHPSPATRHPSPATRHPPPATRHPLSVTSDLLPAEKSCRHKYDLFRLVDYKNLKFCWVHIRPLSLT